MTVERLLLEVLERGVQLWTDGEDLRFRAPEGALTPDLRQRLRRHKAGLVDRLVPAGGDGERKQQSEQYVLHGVLPSRWSGEIMAAAGPFVQAPVASAPCAFSRSWF